MDTMLQGQGRRAAGNICVLKSSIFLWLQCSNQKALNERLRWMLRLRSKPKKDLFHIDIWFFFSFNSKVINHSVRLTPTAAKEGRRYESVSVLKFDLCMSLKERISLINRFWKFLIFWYVWGRKVLMYEMESDVIIWPSYTADLWPETVTCRLSHTAYFHRLWKLSSF